MLTKIFRENSRTFVLVIMALLLVVFLIQDVLQNFSSGGGELNQTVGRAAAYNVDVDTRMLRQALATRDLCKLINLPVGGVAADRFEPLDFALLQAEARHMGIQIGHPQVRTMLEQIFGDKAAEVVGTILRNRNIAESTLYDAVGDCMAINQCLSVQQLGIGDSEARLRNKFREQTEAAVFQVSAVDAAALAETIAAPSDEDTVAFFNEHRDRAPNAAAEDPQSLSFGYRLADRVKLEYVTIDPADLKRVSIRTSEARKHFESNSGRYTKPAPQPESAPVEGEAPPTIPMTFEEAEAQVRSDFREIKAIEEGLKAINELRVEAFSAWRGNAPDESGYRPAPPVQRSLLEIANDWNEKHPDTPVKYQVTDWLSKADLERLPFARDARMTSSRQSVALQELAFRVQGLHKVGPNDNMEVLSIGEPSPVFVRSRLLQGAQRPAQAYLFRVLEAAPAGPPADIGPRMEAVRADLRLKRAYEAAKGHAEAIAVKAREVGLAAAVAEAGELRQKYESQLPPPTDSQPVGSVAKRALDALMPKSPPGVFTRSSMSVIGIGNLSHVASDVFGLANDAGAHRVGVYGVPISRKWAVIEISEIKPLYEGDYAARKQSLSDGMEGYMAQIAVLNPGAIRARAGFAPAPGAVAAE